MDVKKLTEEQREEILERIREKARDYGAGRSMALSFKPLDINDIIETFENGAYEMLQLLAGNTE